MCEIVYEHDFHVGKICKELKEEHLDAYKWYNLVQLRLDIKSIVSLKMY